MNMNTIFLGENCWNFDIFGRISILYSVRTKVVCTIWVCFCLGLDVIVDEIDDWNGILLSVWSRKQIHTIFLFVLFLVASYQNEFVMLPLPFSNFSVDSIQYTMRYVVYVLCTRQYGGKLFSSKKARRKQKYKVEKKQAKQQTISKIHWFLSGEPGNKLYVARSVYVILVASKEEEKNVLDFTQWPKTWDRN